MINEQESLVTDLSELYEMSLNIGKSLDLDKNCKPFFTSIVQRKSFLFISLWQFKYNKLNLLNSHPQLKIDPNNPAEINQVFSPDISEVELGGINKFVGEFEIAKFKVTDLYFYLYEDLCIMFSKNDDEELTKRESNQIATLFKKFCISAKASLSHMSLLDEVIKRQKAEMKLYNSEALFRYGANSLIEGIMATDLDDKISYVNNAMSAITGYSKSEMMGEIAEEILKLDGAHAEVEKEITNTRKTGQQAVYEVELKRADYRNYGARIASNPFMNPKGEVVGSISTILDITESNELKLQTLRNKEKLSLIIDTALDGVLTINKKMRIVDWNKQAELIFGYTKEQAIGDLLTDLIIPERHRSVLKVSLVNFFDKGDSPILNNRLEIIGLNSELQEFPLELAITAVVQEGEPSLSAFVRDITERKNNEKQREQLLKELEAVNQELKDFAYIVSHDLKAPLRGIGSLSDWLIQDYKDVLDEQGQELLKLLKSRISRMHNLIEGVLQFSKVGRLKDEKEEVDTLTMLEEIVDLLDPPKNCSVSIPKELPTVVYDKVRLQQVFQNLISNAIKFIDKPKGIINVIYEEQPKYHKFSVSDNGPGIEESHFEKIFQIFQTLNAKDEFESTGIGLSIVKRIVELNNGKVSIESVFGEGATFSFTVPKIKK